ncbi:hypothetical protein OIU78_019997 [Salix suchowensis]|nr:hypothetical protein OIU78_019997 [Salix suchowensis]
MIICNDSSKDRQLKTGGRDIGKAFTFRAFLGRNWALKSAANPMHFDPRPSYIDLPLLQTPTRVLNKQSKRRDKRTELVCAPFPCHELGCKEEGNGGFWEESWLAFYLLLLLIMSQLEAPCYAVGHGRFGSSNGGSISELKNSPARSTNIGGLKGNADKDGGEIFGAEKRKVYTGPNPLHNR